MTYLAMQMALKQVFNVTFANRGGLAGALPLVSEGLIGAGGSNSTLTWPPDGASIRCGEESRVYHTRTMSGIGVK